MKRTTQPSSIRVLLVEDDEDDFVMARSLLGDIDTATFVLEWTTDFANGLRALRAEPYDVCLVDYRLGTNDGIEFIRAAIEQGTRIPLILLTGQGDRAVDLAAMRAGAADFLSKAQITPQLLERSIRYSIQQKVSEEQRVQFIHEQAARREAEAANRAKDAFLATLSHELRTPLNAILGWAQLLRTGDLDDETEREAVESIERNAKAQSQLIEDLLDVSRIITGKVRLETRPLRLDKVIDAAIDVVRTEARAKGVQIERALDPSAGPGQVVGDATRLQQVLWNLLTNAIKFTPEGGTVTVALARGDGGTGGDGGGLTVTVRDTGHGIDPEFLPHVFDRFRQADSSTTRKHTGLGLGLAIVRHLVELHGGTVRAQSAGAGQGASFIVSLPTAAAPGDAPAASPPDRPSRDATDAIDATDATDAASQGLAAAAVLTGVRVLLVDDEPDTRAYLRKALSMVGADVTAVDSARAAIEAYRSSPPHVLVSDIAMPEEDGYALLGRIRELDRGQGVHTPAIAITAHAGEPDRQRALVCGFAAYLPKPIETGRLIRTAADLAGCKPHPAPAPQAV